MTRTLTNSIVYGVTLDDGNYAVSEIEVEDYNCYYGNTGNRDYSGTGGNNDICAANANAINPLLADLLYLTRIESGGTLKTAGTDGGQIGAEIIKKIGVSGTLYGEPGWNETTNVDLWPFPNENEMKEDMGSFYKSAGQIYTGSPEMDGARGFAASGTGIYDGPITLTSYIWEYLGNECPPEICNYNVTEIICIDSDGDGYNQSQSGCGTADCNDTNSSIYPGAIEICGNGIDEDCDGSDLNCTEDITSPIISDITATPSTTSATINWITDEAATSIVEYGLTTS
ncbi:putative metal-binding motif-containing protein, partial [Candidatus Pacearchaeota archaeon]|nr:putative metal-binding motif-containing protein [Candidatus Pacearchaeota archaeon]